MFTLKFNLLLVSILLLQHSIAYSTEEEENQKITKVKREFIKQWSIFSQEYHKAETVFINKTQPEWKKYNQAAKSSQPIAVKSELFERYNAISDSLLDEKKETIDTAYYNFLNMVHSILKEYPTLFKGVSAKDYIINYHPKTRRKLQSFGFITRKDTPQKVCKMSMKWRMYQKAKYTYKKPG